MTLSFAVTYDYRCPFARNAHEHLLDGLESGADWDVHFVPFSLSQSKEPTWNAESDSGLVALELSIAVRDGQPDVFRAAHRALFSVRHDRGESLQEPDALRRALDGAGVDTDAAFAAVADGTAAATTRQEHDRSIAEHTCWGVPTFIVGDQAAFVRLMDRPATAELSATETVERIVGTLGGWPALNEFKHTSIAR